MASATVADLGAFATGPCNDMVVDARGGAYIGNFGFDLFAEPIVRGALRPWSTCRPTVWRASPPKASSSRTAR